MAGRAVEFMNQRSLRLEAERLLAKGTARSAHGRAAGAEALTLLYNMASSPGSAGDALKFLHELQVHQVELDLQHEQLERSRIEQSEALDRYLELYDLAPVSFLHVDHDGKIMDANRAGAELLGVDRAEIGGRRIDRFMTAASGPALLALLKRAIDGRSRETGQAQTEGVGAASKSLRVVARGHSDGRSCLLILIDAGEWSH